MLCRTALQVDCEALRSNLRRLGGRDAWAVVKANAYGHGAVGVAEALDGRCKGFCVATATEGAQLRGAGVSAPILVLGDVPQQEWELLFDCRLTPTVFCPENARDLAGAAAARGQRLGVHLALDSGMGRIGFACTPGGVDEALNCLGEWLRPKGVFTHFATASDPGSPLFELQRRRFAEALAALRARGLGGLDAHASNSAAALGTPGLWGVRAGLALYGVSPFADKKAGFGLRPAMKWVAKIVQIHTAQPGDNIGYDARFTAPSPLRIATVSVGYADGLPREGAMLTIGGRLVPVLGPVCMDACMADVTHTAAEVGEEAVLVGDAPGASAADVAARAGRSVYELLAGISARVQRTYSGQASDQG